ncbi:MAG: undecaprenyl-diphosphate phosphatase [bacterium]|nr:undecaprenyl-diphosphate phosphatase [bacterium]
MVEILQAIFLGIVEGLTEFLPISSTGHLIVAEHVIGFRDTSKLFTVVIQVGAIGAVIWHYRADIIKRVISLIKWETSAQNFWLNLVIATLPAGIVGLLLESTIEKYSVPSTVAITLIVGGFVLIWAENKFTHDKQTAGNLDSITPKQALGIGTAQILSLVPGVSRSGSTIVGGMLAGLKRDTAAEFSFWLAMPVIILASGYKLIKYNDELASLPGGNMALLIGTISAFFSALLVVNWLLKYIARHDFKPFAYYRIGFGIFLLVLLITNLLSNSA